MKTTNSSSIANGNLKCETCSLSASFHTLKKNHTNFAMHFGRQIRKLTNKTTSKDIIEAGSNENASDRKYSTSMVNICQRLLSQVKNNLTVTVVIHNACYC